jgi:hypothetical protein
VVAALLLLGLADLLDPDAIQDLLPGVPNLVGIESTGPLGQAGFAAFDLLTLPSLAAAVVMLLLRLRRARGAARHALATRPRPEPGRVTSASIRWTGRVLHTVQLRLSSHRSL